MNGFLRRLRVNKTDLIEYCELLLDRVRNDRFRELDEQYHNDPAITKVVDALYDEPSERVTIG